MVFSKTCFIQRVALRRLAVSTCWIRTVRTAYLSKQNANKKLIFSLKLSPATCLESSRSACWRTPATTRRNGQQTTAHPGRGAARLGSSPIGRPHSWGRRDGSAKEPAAVTPSVQMAVQAVRADHTHPRSLQACATRAIAIMYAASRMYSFRFLAKSLTATKAPVIMVSSFPSTSSFSQ